MDASQRRGYTASSCPPLQVNTPQESVVVDAEREENDAGELEYAKDRMQMGYEEFIHLHEHHAQKPKQQVDDQADDWEEE